MVQLTTYDARSIGQVEPDTASGRLLQGAYFFSILPCTSFTIISAAEP